MITKTFALTALTAASLALATPVAANGTFSFTLNASNQDEADAIQAGLMLYQIVQGVESGAFVHQDGTLNGAAIAQVAHRAWKLKSVQRIMSFSPTFRPTRSSKGFIS